MLPTICLRPPRRDRLERRGPAAGPARRSPERARPRPGRRNGRSHRASDPRGGRLRFRRKPAHPHARDHGDRSRRDGARSRGLPHRRAPSRDRFRRLGGLHAGRTQRDAARADRRARSGQVDASCRPAAKATRCSRSASPNWLGDGRRDRPWWSAHGGVGRVLLGEWDGLAPAVIVTTDFPQDQIMLWRDGKVSWL